MRHLIVPVGWAGLAAAALAVAGCAWQAMETSSEVKPGIVEPAEGKDMRTAAPKPKDKIAAVKKKPDTYTPAAKELPAPPAAHHDEARCPNVDTCVSVLKAMVADPQRAWIQQPATPAVLANGVRL